MSKGGRRKRRGGKDGRGGGKAVSGHPSVDLAALQAPVPPAGPSAPSGDSPGEPLFARPHLLETSRTKWQYGEWQDLAQIPPASLETHPDRARIALLIGAAKAQLGETDAARVMIRQAAAWGCNRDLIARVLVSMVENSLGRMAASLEDDAGATRHFEAAIGLVETRADTPLLARTRRLRETARMGLLPDAAKLLGEDLQAAGAAPADHQARLEGMRRDIDLIGRQLAALKEASPIAAPVDRTRKPAMIDPARFSGEDILYIDSKSLPRSGLHYFRDRLAEVLGTGFSFCEWYNEPGCCRQMPCNVFPLPGPKGHLRLRLQKSHDFDLTDPAFEPGPAMRRVVLVRDPLAVLTSWWSLHILYLNKTILGEAGIRTEKISYLHETPVVTRAHEIVAASGRIPDEKTLRKFLTEKSDYIRKFVSKWAGPQGQTPDPKVDVLRYQDIPAYVVSLLESRKEALSPSAQSRLEEMTGRLGDVFRPRGDPFRGASDAVTAYLQEHAELFRAEVARLLERDETGLLLTLSR